MITYVKGDILDSKETYIVHQCNCRTTTPKGLSHQIFKKFPYSNVYKNNPRTLGTIEIRGNIVALYAQDYPGQPRNTNDTRENREIMFQECLDILSGVLKQGETVAFPDHIGCGLARGNWSNYLKMITDFSEKHSVVIYKLD